jgi:hypothetical protein
MPTEYLNRARRTSDGVLVYWTTIGAADPTLASGNAPSPAGDYADAVVVQRRASAPEIRQASLSGQVDGNTSTFSTPSSYRSGTLVVRWNGQVQALGDLTETSDSSFTLSLTPEAGDAIEVQYRPA